ncbi:MAG: DUF938 domain-containing protein [Alphaproteobacteria bacterium]|nr:DUF938 domain-containing protein [Alphaproteobacteria bacterium]
MPEKEIALEDRASDEDRLFSPSAARNRDVIREAFLDLARAPRTVVEIAAGTGEHAVHIAAALPEAEWRPGDPDEASRRSIAAWTHHLGLTNVARPHAVDVIGAEWRTGATGEPPFDRPADAIVCINMIHIAPFAAAQGLIEGAGRRLAPHGILFLYGPFSRNGAHVSSSNADFDASLRSRDARWGVRDLERDIVPIADGAGLRLIDARAMPANNHVVVFERP